MESKDRNGIPTLEEAKILLEEAGELNPGPWIEHSIYAGKAAQLIAQNCEGIDSETALIFGMIHDIGRRFGVTGMRHGINEYTTLKWKATFEIKEYFEKKMGKSVYSILPGVVENTFGLK